MYSTEKNITSAVPEVSEDAVTSRYIKYPDKTGRRQAEGGLRLQGKYKQSIDNRPLVTVITIAFNNCVGLESTIKSVIAQTYDNIEYIIVDGGSTDNTLQVIKKYESAVDYYISEPDGGIYNAMNKGIELSSGVCINFMNSGDIFFDKDVLSKLSSYFIRADIIFGNGINKGLCTKHPLPIDSCGNIVLENFFNNSSLCHQSSFISKKLFEKMGYYDTSFKVISDHYFFILAFKKYNASYLYVKLDIAIIDITGISTNNEILDKETENLKKIIKRNQSILFVYPHNFLKKDNGVNRRIYNVVKSLSKLNIEMDLLGLETGLWDNFHKENKSENKIIRNLTLIKPDYSMRTNELMDLYLKSDMDEKFKNNRKYYDIIIMVYSYASNSIFKYFDTQYKICLMEDFLSLQGFYMNKKIDNFCFLLKDEINRMLIFDSLVYISYDELTFFSHIFSKKSFYLPHTNDINPLIQIDPNKILFLGADNIHNVEAARWLISDVLPHIDSNLKITIVGNVCNFVTENQQIEKLYYVDNIDEIYKSTKIIICPMKSGSGMKIKVIEAMSMGIPIVSTSFGLDGFINKMNTGVLIADDGINFASYILQLKDDTVFYNACKEKLKKFYLDFYNTYRFEKIINDIINYIPTKTSEWLSMDTDSIMDSNLRYRKRTFLEYVFSVYVEEKFVVIYLFGIKISLGGNSL